MKSMGSLVGVQKRKRSSGIPVFRASAGVSAPSLLIRHKVVPIVRAG